MATPQTEGAVAFAASDDQIQDICSTLEEMKESMASVREVIKSVQAKYVSNTIQAYIILT